MLEDAWPSFLASSPRSDVFFLLPPQYEKLKSWIFMDVSFLMRFCKVRIKLETSGVVSDNCRVQYFNNQKNWFHIKIVQPQTLFQTFLKRCQMIDFFPYYYIFPNLKISQKKKKKLTQSDCIVVKWHKEVIN